MILNLTLLISNSKLKELTMTITNLKKLRLQKNLTQKELGSILHVSESAICRWEKGSRLPRFQKVNEILQLFDITIFDLID